MSVRPARFKAASAAHTPPRPALRRLSQALALSLPLGLSLLLSGCAGQLAFREGKDLVAQNKVEEALGKFQQAMQADPQSPQFKSAWLQTRERAVNSFLQEADRIAPQKPEQARQLYQRVLNMEPDNTRAKDGLQNLDEAVRHAAWVQEAQAAWEKKDAIVAKARLDLILKENPRHAAALQLQRAMQEVADKANPRQAQLAAAYRKPITIEFRDASVKQVFDVIARTSGLNILFDKDVRQDQKMSIFLKNSTIEAAIHFALLTNQLEQQTLDGNTILIYPNQPAKQKEYQEVVVRSFFLSNAEAKAVANSIKTIVKTRDVVVDEKLNMIVLRDSPEAIKIAEKLVQLHDQPEPEVMLEVEILEVKRTRLMELGIKWPDTMSLELLPTSTTSGLTLRDVLSNINSRTVKAGVNSGAVNVRKIDSDVNLLANPRIRARNHEKAKILIGERVPSITSTSTSSGFVSESVNYIDVGLKLDVEPSVYLDNDVSIKVAMEVSNIVSETKTNSGTTAYRIGTRTASTMLRLKDGETQVLAGLLNDEERRSGNKIPGLGDLPVVGRLFGSTNDNAEKTEIVLSITPRLIRNIQRPDASLAEFRAGTEGSMRVRPDSLGAPTVLPKAAGSTGSSTGSSGNVGGNPTTPALPDKSGTNNPGSTSGTSGSSGSSGSSISAIGNTNTTAGSGSTANLETGAAAPAPGQPQLRWQGPPVVKVGENFSVQLVIYSDQPIASLPLALSYDPKVLQVVGVTEGDFLKHGGANTQFTSKIDPGGQILVSSTRTAPGGASDSGAIVTLNFRALAPSDSSRLQLITIAPVTANGTGVVISLPVPYGVQVRP